MPEIKDCKKYGQKKFMNLKTSLFMSSLYIQRARGGRPTAQWRTFFRCHKKWTLFNVVNVLKIADPRCMLHI